jgi:hypothetical protein
MPLTLRIDRWNPDYESAFQLDEEQAPPEGVDPLAETADWRPIAPKDALPRPGSIVFVDGVQRVETRVVGEDDGAFVYGAFVSIAVGATIARPDGSSVRPCNPHRIIALGEGRTYPSQEIACGGLTLSFDAESSPDHGVDAWRKAVDRVRRDREATLGRELADGGHDLVIVDGRLTFQPTRSHALGLSKSVRTVYLERPYSDVIAQLPPGTRTPVFSIPYDNAVYSWYVRLAAPRRAEHAYTGIVQVETFAGIGISEATRLADLTAAHLPAFASTTAWDARSPQNLYPVAALERRLRHLLGDPDLVRRSIEVHFHRTGVAA